MAIKPRRPQQSAPLEGEDARALQEYMKDPKRPPGHTKHLKQCDAEFAKQPKLPSANRHFSR